MVGITMVSEQETPPSNTVTKTTHDSVETDGIHSYHPTRASSTSDLPTYRVSGRVRRVNALASGFRSRMTACKEESLRAPDARSFSNLPVQSKH